MKSLLFDNHNTVPTEANHQPTFSLIDMIGSRSREVSPIKKSAQYDFADTKKYEGYQPDFSQSRSPKNPSMSTKLREHRSIPNNIHAGLEDSLDVFQRENLRGGLSPSRVEEKYSPTLRNSPNKLGTQGEISPGKKEQAYPFLDLNASSSESKYKNSISSLPKMHSPKNSRIESEIMMSQKPLEKKFDPTTRVRDFNIVTNERASPNSNVLSGLPFGYAARSLERGLEDVHMKAVLQYKKMDPESPVHSPLKRQESYFTPKEQTYDKKLDNIGVVYGKNSSYKETEYRYANKQDYQPLSPNQLYSAKALKNLSAFKLY